MKTKNIKAEIFTGTNTVQQINDWLNNKTVRVINIETMIKSSGGGSSFSDDVKLSRLGTKVWYEELAS